MTEQKKKQLPVWQESILLVATAMVMAIIVKTFFLQAFYIPSESMEPTMLVNDKILVQKVSYWGGDVKRGDVVVFDDPGGWLSAEDSKHASNPVQKALETVGLFPTGGHLIKRVVGVGGDRIAVRDGHVVRNGKLQSESFTAACAGGQGCDLPRAITVPQGYVFCMGDNRGASDDGRFWGPIPVDWVIGGAFATYWPPKRIGTL